MKCSFFDHIMNKKGGHTNFWNKKIQCAFSHMDRKC